MPRRQNLCTIPSHGKTAFHNLDPFGEPLVQRPSTGRQSDGNSLVETIKNPASLSTRQLEEPPSCIKFCPGNEEYVVLGTYVLSTPYHNQEVAAKQRRLSSLVLQKLDSTTGTQLSSFTLALNCAILDLQFHPLDSHIFGISTSDGKVGILSWFNDPVTLKHIGWIYVSDGSDALVTSMTWVMWSEVVDPHQERVGLAVTLTDGCVRLYAGRNLHLLGEVEHTYRFQSHSQEAWYVAFSETFKLLLSGGDDTALHIYKLNPLEPAGLQTEVPPLWIDRKSHGAGVTAILPFEQVNDPFSNCSYILTGSYDEYLRVFKLDQTSTKKAVVVEESLGGGVWRLKQVGDTWREGPSPEFTGQRICSLIMASCMHAGVRILQVVRTCAGQCAHDFSSSCLWTVDVVAKFEEHESMNYASDVRMVNGALQFVSTSFYDKRVCVWPLEQWTMGQNALRAATQVEGQ